MPDIYTPAHSPTPNPLRSSRLQDRDHQHVPRIAQALAAVITADPDGSVLIDDIAAAVNAHLSEAGAATVPVASVRRTLVAAGVQTVRGDGSNSAVGVRLR